MSLLERVAQATTCRVQGCRRRRVPDAEVCGEDLTELWAHRLHREADGSYARRFVVRAREDGSWRVAV